MESSSTEMKYLIVNKDFVKDARQLGVWGSPSNIQEKSNHILTL